VHQGYDYGRSHNPTRFAFERCVADLEGGAQAFAFASGLAAISTVLELVDASSHVVSSDDVYGGTFRLFDKVRQRSAGLRFSYADLTNPENLLAALRPDTKLVWVETPTNPLLRLADLRAIAEICRARGIVSVADNTFASPYVQRPLELGFDVVVHSVTKYLNGHSDVIGGIAIVAKSTAQDVRLDALRERLGSCRTRSARSRARSTASGAARRQDAGAAHAAACRERPRPRAVARSAAAGRARATPASNRTRSTSSRSARCATSTAATSPSCAPTSPARGVFSRRCGSSRSPRAWAASKA
jgi:cystathionine gamma-lyase